MSNVSNFEGSISPSVEIYKVVPPEVVRHTNGAIEAIVAAFDREVGDEIVRVPVGRVVTEPYEQELELPFVRASAHAPTARITGRAYRAKVYEEINPVLYPSGRIEPNKHNPKTVARNLHVLQSEATRVVLDYLGLEPFEQKQSRWERFKLRFAGLPYKANAPTR